MYFSYVTLASSGELVLRHIPSNSIILSLSSLFVSSSKTLSCRFSPSLTNLLIWAKVEPYQPTVLSGLGLLDFQVLTIGAACGEHQGAVGLS